MAGEVSPEAPQTEAGRRLPPGYTVWKAWYDGMLRQSREVHIERTSWDTLPAREKELDIAIEAEARAPLIEALRGVGWNERDGLCWCRGTPDHGPDAPFGPHESRCEAIRALLSGTAPSDPVEADGALGSALDGAMGSARVGPMKQLPSHYAAHVRTRLNETGWQLARAASPPPPEREPRSQGGK